jgi:hypothetical protein
METQISMLPRLMAVLPAREIKGYVLYTFFLLIFSMTTCILLYPEALARIEDPFVMSSTRKSVMALGGVLTVAVLFVGPVLLFVNAVARYLAARSLDRLGVITKGSILQKWVDTVDDQCLYRVSYQFKSHLRAWQTVPPQFYEGTSPGQTVEVLHLEGSPHLSRLELDA